MHSGFIRDGLTAGLCWAQGPLTLCRARVVPVQPCA